MQLACLLTSSEVSQVEQNRLQGFEMTVYYMRVSWTLRPSQTAARNSVVKWVFWTQYRSAVLQPRSTNQESWYRSSGKTTHLGRPRWRRLDWLRQRLDERVGSRVCQIGKRQATLEKRGSRRAWSLTLNHDDVTWRHSVIEINCVQTTPLAECTLPCIVIIVPTSVLSESNHIATLGVQT